MLTALVVFDMGTFTGVLDCGKLLNALLNATPSVASGFVLITFLGVISGFVLTTSLGVISGSVAIGIPKRLATFFLNPNA